MKTIAPSKASTVTPISTLERLLAMLLQYGSWLAFAVVGVGIALCLAPRVAPDRFAGVASTGNAIVVTGVAGFIALPVLRLALMCAVFLRQRDYRFFCIAALVLCIVACGCVLGVKLGPVGG